MSRIHESIRYRRDIIMANLQELGPAKCQGETVEEKTAKYRKMNDSSFTGMYNDALAKAEAGEDWTENCTDAIAIVAKERDADPNSKFKFKLTFNG